MSEEKTIVINLDDPLDDPQKINSPINSTDINTIKFVSTKDTIDSFTYFCIQLNKKLTHTIIKSYKDS